MVGLTVAERIDGRILEGAERLQVRWLKGSRRHLRIAEIRKPLHPHIPVAPRLGGNPFNGVVTVFRFASAVRFQESF